MLRPRIAGHFMLTKQHILCNHLLDPTVLQESIVVCKPGEHITDVTVGYGPVQGPAEGFWCSWSS